MSTMLLIAVLLLCLGEVKTRACNGERKLLTAPEGRIESPDAEENGTCFWNISVPPQFRIIFYFISYDIDSCSSEKCTGCTAVVLKDHGGDPAWRKFCQSSMPQPIQSGGSSFSIDFMLLEEDYRSSFIAEYITTTFKATIDLRKTSSAVISSPNFPGKYPRNSYYQWSIIAPSGYRVKVKFSKFDIKSCDPVCSCDFLRVYDGTSKEDSLFERYCNDKSRPVIVTSGEHMWMEFVSSAPSPREYYSDSLGFRATVTKEIQLYIILVPCVFGILIMTLLAAIPVYLKRRRQNPSGPSSPVMKMSLLEEDGVSNSQISDASQPDQASLQAIQPVYLPTTRSINA